MLCTKMIENWQFLTQRASKRRFHLLLVMVRFQLLRMNNYLKGV